MHHCAGRPKRLPHLVHHSCMRIRCLPFFLALHAAWAQAPTVLSTDVINLRNFSLSPDGSEVVYAAALDRNARSQGVTNLYSTVLGSNPITTRLTDYQGDDPLYGVMALDLSVTGRLVYTALTNFLTQEEQIRIIDGGGDRVLATDKEGCVRIACVNCYSLCVRNVHISGDGQTVLYASVRDYPFYTVTVSGSVRRKIDTVYQGALAPSGQRVISQAGKVVFTSSAPFGPTFAPAATDVYIMNLDGTAIQQVTRLSPVSSHALDATIAANGSWIAFTRIDGPNSQIWIVRPDGSGLRRLSDGTTNATSPSLSSDGGGVSFIQQGQVKLVSTLLDPLALPFAAEITKFSVSAAQSAILTADGRRVGFLLGPPGGLPASIYTAPVSGGNRFEQLTQVYAPRVLFTPGVVSAGGTAAPSVGSLMTAYGANLSPEEFSTASALPLPTKLGGIELLANLEPMPLQAVTPWQINAQLAGSRIPGTVSFRVRDARGDTSGEARKLVAASAPEAIPMPAVSQPGFLLAAAVFPGTQTLANAARPAAAGETLEIYALGLGETIPIVEVGTASPSPPARAKVTPRLQIGGRDAEISFAGLVPGLAGVYQVNAKVPGVSPGYQPLRWIATDGTVSGTSGIFVR